MESQIEIIERLIEEGKTYTFQNFCLATSEYQGQCGGADTPEWSTFKIRTQNIVSKILSDTSPANTLVAEGITSLTEGNGSDKFDIAKSNLVKALEILLSTLKDDVFGELGMCLKQLPEKYVLE